MVSIYSIKVKKRAIEIEARNQPFENSSKDTFRSFPLLPIDKIIDGVDNAQGRTPESSDGNWIRFWMRTRLPIASPPMKNKVLTQRRRG